MKRLLVAMLLVASSAEAAVSVRAWKPAGASRFLLQCIADAVIDLPTCASVNDGFDCRVLATNAIYICDGSGSWTSVGGGAGVSDGDKGDISVTGSGATWTIDADTVALATDTTGNYVSGVTANQGVLSTGTEGASVGLIDCAATEILKRNAGDTAWECATDGGGSGAPTTVDYVVKTADAGLSAERVLTDTATVAWDWGTAGQAKANAVTSRLSSWDNPPASPHSYDDEFDAGTLDAKWTITSTGTTNAAVTGTIDYTASLTTPIVDAATIPGWMAFQCDNSTLQSFGITQTVSLATNATFFFKIGGQTRDPSTGAEGDFYLSLWNSGDSNEWIHLGVSRNTTTGGALAQMSNNGSLTTSFSTDFNNNGPASSYYLAMWKKSDVYYYGSANANGIFTLLGGAMTKTGVTTFDRLSFGYFSTSANETPSIIDGVDFFRYKDSLDYSLVNP